MDIAPVTANIQSIAAIGPQLVVFSVVTPTSTSSYTVDISSLGSLLAASALFENQTGFSNISTATQSFVSAYNVFLQDMALQANLTEQLLNAGTNLSGIGIALQGNNQLTIDLNALQSAYNANPSGTTTQLAEATQTIGQLATAISSPVPQIAAATTAATTAATPAVQVPVSFTINSADPAVAAAIASYHVIDGIFDMDKPHDERTKPRAPDYSESGPVAPVKPASLNLRG
jgi:hypothetical protein